MANTSVHLPDDLLSSLDREAARRGMSRNRLIVRACERVLSLDGGEWPREYFSQTRFAPGDLRDLRAGFQRWMTAITASRRSATGRPF